MRVDLRLALQLAAIAAITYIATMLYRALAAWPANLEA
jgi:hypothetical protein